MREFEIVVAADEEGGIGRDGDLPWRLPGDLAYFRALTVGDGSNAVIMGRHTWESLPPRFQPLPERTNIILSRRGVHPVPDGVLQATSLDAALELATGASEVFVIGGGILYREALQRPECRRVHLTRVRGRFDCDTFFPAIESRDDEWAEESASEPKAEHGIRYTFHTYRRL